MLIQQQRNDRAARWAALAIGTTVLIGLSGRASAQQVSQPSGAITSPHRGAEVSRLVRAEGWATELPADHRLWLAVEVQDRLWPKQVVHLEHAGGWSAVVDQPGGPYTLTLLLVPPEGQRVIDAWFAHGQRTSEYPGLERIPGATRLDSSESLRTSAGANDRPDGEITQPRRGEKLLRPVRVRGWATELPADHRLWLAVEVQDRLWPKQVVHLEHAGGWSAVVDQPGGPYTLTLLLVPPEGQRVIDAWFAHGQRTSEYPGLERIPGATRLDSVQNLRSF